MKPTLSPQFKRFWHWLQEAAKNLLSLLKGIFFMILAAFLLVLAAPVAGVQYLLTIKSRKQKAREFLTATGNFGWLVALAIDHLANVAYPGLWTQLFLKNPKTKFPFGMPGESLSEILGWNYDLDNLNDDGLALRFLLDLLDPNHCENAKDAAVNKAMVLLNKYKAIQAKIETIAQTKSLMPNIINS